MTRLALSASASLIAISIGTVPVAAQQREPVAQRLPPAWQVAPITRAVVGVHVFTDSAVGDGVPITAITPGSPADRAGLRTGDVITRINGRPLTNPAIQLWLLQSRLRPEDTVAIEVRRGNSRRTVHLVPILVNDVPPMAPIGEDRSVVLQDTPFERFGGPPPANYSYFRGPLIDLELAPINPELGRYFGTDDGVLVIRAPDESGLGLRGGDVIITVDGRRPDGPSQLLRILATYAPDDSIRFEVIRMHKRHRVTGQLAAR